ncbi:hypothetical protein [Thiocapsa sp. N5-Cardenillas]|uniref:hypothetical protein n=1 Tax=Thiocapsa sp. N5-Cardenillas TaxID=3137397 RepID=UPI0035AF6997
MDTNGNSGDLNSGYRNSGDWNSGDRNSGHWNSGYWNSGDRNSGDRNSGHWNSGYWNSGYRNSGDLNSGHWNSGHWNSGDLNSGHWNSGHWNSGDRNSGHWNSGDRNSGYFNTDIPPLRMFNRDTNVKSEDIQWPDFLMFKLTKWVESSEMTEAEKTDHPSHVTTGGYLKTYEYKEAFRKAWDSATDEDKKKLFALPNFDAVIFKEISGIDVSENANCKGE